MVEDLKERIKGGHRLVTCGARTITKPKRSVLLCSDNSQLLYDLFRGPREVYSRRASSVNGGLGIAHGRQHVLLAGKIHSRTVSIEAYSKAGIKS